MSLLNFTKLQKEQGEWADATFGENRTPLVPLHHLLEEVAEVIEDPSDLEEYADCLLLLMDSIRLSGFNMDDVYFATISKMKKNKTRKWGDADENGVVNHIKE